MSSSSRLRRRHRLLPASSAGALVLLVVTVGTTLALLGFALVQAATACALVQLDEGRPVGPVHAYRLALTKLRPLFGGLALVVGAWVALTGTGILIPVAIWLAVHASIQTTFDLYGHLMPGNDDEAVALVDAYLERANTDGRLAQID